MHLVLCFTGKLSCTSCAQCCGDRSLEFPPGAKNKFGISRYLVVPVLSNICQHIVPCCVIAIVVPSTKPDTAPLSTGVKISGTKLFMSNEIVLVQQLSTLIGKLSYYHRTVVGPVSSVLSVLHATW
jgi:hypothetical protein